MGIQDSKYSASFTAGGLLIEEMLSLLDYLDEDNIVRISEQIKNNTKLKTNSESARKRIIWEIRYRYNSVDNNTFSLLKDVSFNEQKIILFYICLKAYKVMLDFQIEVVLEKWRTRDLNLTTKNVEIFLDQKSGEYLEIETWSTTTRKKIATVAIRMLNEVGLLQNNYIQPVTASDSFWNYFIKIDESWFLEAMLLNKKQRDRITKLE